MLASLSKERLLIRSVDGRTSYELPMSGFSYVSGLALSPSARYVALTAVPAGRRTPSLNDNFPGEIGLFVSELSGGEWRVVHPGYAHDPAWFPDEQRLAFATNLGVGVAGLDGSGAREFKSGGRFNWGPPSVSVSPDGSHLGFVRWKGDDRHLATCDLRSGEVTVHSHTCFAYTWMPDGSIVFERGDRLHRLEISGGRATPFLKDPRALSAASGHDAELLELRESWSASAAGAFEKPHYVYGRLFFQARVACDKRYDTVVSTLPDLTGFQRHFRLDAPRRSFLPWLQRNGMIRGYQVLNGGRTLAVRVEYYDGSVRLRETRDLLTGEGACLLEKGFGSLASSPAPDFGFHYMGQCEGAFFGLK
jgi:hypothetical protein